MAFYIFSTIYYGMDSIGERIATRRAEIGLSQADLAGLLKIDNVSVSRWETNKTKPNRHLLALARALKVTPEWVIHGGAHLVANGAGISFSPEPSETPLDELSPEGIRRKLNSLPMRVIDIAFRLQRFGDTDLRKVKNFVEHLEIEIAEQRPPKKPDIRSI